MTDVDNAVLVIRWLKQNGESIEAECEQVPLITRLVKGELTVPYDSDGGYIVEQDDEAA